MGLDRRQALWEVSTRDQRTAIFSADRFNGSHEEEVELPEMSPSEHVVQDYASTSLSVKAHPVSFIREELRSLNTLSASQLLQAKDGDHVRIAGIVLVRQRPGTASGVCFITIEDETGCANLVVWRDLFNKYRKEILQSTLLMVEGKLQVEGEVIHVIVKRCHNMNKLLNRLVHYRDENASLTATSRADEKTDPHPPKRVMQKKDGVQGEIFGEGRNFR
jgi:error-prone DNA polymerase